MKTMQLIPLLLMEAAPTPMAEQLPLKDLGTTYAMAQAVRWLDERNFAIGRWDGTLTIFHRAGIVDGGPPVVSAALVVPSLAGVEMIARVKSDLFASSNESGSMIVWDADGDFQDGIRLKARLEYDESVGVANDGTTTESDGVRYFVSGHANGYLLVWKVEGEDDAFTLMHMLDLRSPNPIPSPYPLKNIRGVERWRPGYVVTGSEDGDICLINVVKGEVVARMRYNDTAQRGINDIDTCGDNLVLANCSVGEADKNTWLYRIHEDGFELLDAVNLKVDSALKQVFNFCVDQAVVGDKQYFFAATQEGVVWIGLVHDGRFVTLGKQAVSTRFGAALAFETDSHLLAVAGDNIHLFEVL
jgi:hypothetical protein